MATAEMSLPCTEPAPLSAGADGRDGNENTGEGGFLSREAGCLGGGNGPRGARLGVSMV